MLCLMKNDVAYISTKIFGARRLPEGVNLFVSHYSMMRWVGMCCSSHWCCQYNSKSFYVDSPNNFFLNICPLYFLQYLKGSLIFPERYSFKFHTFNKLKAHVLFEIVKLPYFIQFEISSRAYGRHHETSCVYERPSVTRP